MNMPDERLVQRARGTWQDAAERLDATTAGRLRAARRSALAAAEAPARPALQRWLVPTGAFAAVALAAVMLWQPLRAPAPGATPVASAQADLDDDLPPDADQADPALLQDLDFYAWLAANGTATANR